MGDKEFKEYLKEKLSEFIEVTEKLSDLRKRKNALDLEIKKIMHERELKKLEYRDYEIKYISFKKTNPINQERIIEMFHKKISNINEDKANQILEEVREEIDSIKEENKKNVETIKIVSK